MQSRFDSDALSLVAQIHDSDARACLVVTGGGMSATSALFAVGGASRTIIDAQIPYARAALDEYLGEVAPQHVSAHEAVLMAKAAHRRAVGLDASGEMRDGRAVGVSCTSAIATDRERRGTNRCHVAWFDGMRGTVYSLTMTKGARSRAQEESICGAMVLNALAAACRLDCRLDIELLAEERVTVDDV